MAFVENLEIENFRAIKNAKLDFCTGVNFILGENAQGKTSVLESLHILAGLQSFRDSDLESAVSFDTDFFKVKAELSTGGLESLWKKSISVAIPKKSSPSSLVPGAKKRLVVAEKAERSTLSYLRAKNALGFYVVCYQPLDHDLILGNPQTRRKYVDKVLGAFDSDYLENLVDLQRVLAQRNANLRSQAFEPTMHGIYTEKLSEISLKIRLKRKEFIHKLNPVLATNVEKIATAQKSTQLHYMPNVLDFEPTQMLLPRERALGYSIVGAQRDKFEFQLGGEDLHKVASQGEMRTTLLALKIAEAETCIQETKQKPVFLVDDLSSELDWSRRAHLFDRLLGLGLQVLTTSTDEELPEVRHCLESGASFRVFKARWGQLTLDREGFAHEFREQPVNTEHRVFSRQDQSP